MDYLIVSSLQFGLNLVSECHKSSRSICHVQSQASMSWLNLFPFLDWLNWVESYNLIQLVLSGDLCELSIISYYLFLLNIYTPMFFPLPPFVRWWNTLSTVFQCIWLGQPKPYTKYSRMIYPNIPGIFIYSHPYGTNDRS